MFEQLIKGRRSRPEGSARYQSTNGERKNEVGPTIKKTHQTLIFTQIVIVSALSTRGAITGARLCTMLEVSGFPVTEIKLANVFARVKVVAAGLEQVAIGLPMRGYADIEFVLVLVTFVVVTVVVVVVG